MNRLHACFVLAVPFVVTCATSPARTEAPATPATRAEQGAAKGTEPSAGNPMGMGPGSCTFASGEAMSALPRPTVERTARGADLVFKSDAATLASLKPRLEAMVAHHAAMGGAGTPQGHGRMPGQRGAGGTGMGMQGGSDGRMGMGIGMGADMPAADVTLAEKPGELRLVHVAREPARVADLQQVLDAHAARMGSGGCLDAPNAP